MAKVTKTSAVKKYLNLDWILNKWKILKPLQKSKHMKNIQYGQYTSSSMLKERCRMLNIF